VSSQYTKWAFEVPTPERIPEAVARAFAIAAQPPMGPVHLAIPSDLFAEAAAGEIPCGDFARTRSFPRASADEQGLTEAAELLARASQPLLLFGSEIGQYNEAIPAAVRLAEVLGAPVCIDDQASYLPFPTTHPQYAGIRRENAELIGAADVLLTVGIELTAIGSPEPPPLPPAAKTIALSVDPQLPIKQSWPDLALVGHPLPSLEHLAALLDERISVERVRQNRSRAAFVRARRLERAAELRALPRNGPAVLPSALIDVVHRRCGADWIVVDALTSAAQHFDLLYELDDPRRYHTISGKASAQGWGAPTAIGVQIASPQQRVVALLGDGNFMFSSSSVYLAARLKLPIVFVIVNNGGWASVRSSIRMGSAEPYPDEHLAALGWLFDECPIDYVKYAESLGLSAGRATTAAELALLLEAADTSRRPWLIDVVTEGDPARDGKAAPFPWETEDA
jgi:thiamine pyrophosphate-dependent acetolactate synthase large subunit-like protein